MMYIPVVFARSGVGNAVVSLIIKQARVAMVVPAAGSFSFALERLQADVRLT